MNPGERSIKLPLIGRHSLVVSLAYAATLFTITLGILALIGWYSGLSLLASFGANRIPMAPSTALLFLLFGVAVLLRLGAPLSRPANLSCNVLAGFGSCVAVLLFAQGWLGFQWQGEHLGLDLSGTVSGAPIGHISLVTAFCFMLAGGSLLASSIHNESFWRVAAFSTAGILLGVTFVFLLSYGFGNPLLYGSNFIPPALNTSLAFFTLGLALALISRPPRLAGVDHGGLSLGLVLIFVVLTLGIITGGYAYYMFVERHYRAEVQQQLAAIADLKAGELAQYRDERLADAEVLHDNPSITGLVNRFLSSPHDRDAQQQLQVWLGKYQSQYDYSEVRILDVEGGTRLSIPARHAPVGAEVRRNATESLRAGQVLFQDFYRNDQDQKVYLGILIPVMDDKDQLRPLGVIYLQIDPESYLYPFISRWPVPSETAESLLVRREGEEVVFLNELRFQKNTALNLRVPITRADLPAVMAAQGQTGIVRGRDYRGVPVKAAVRSIPDSPWFLVARRDTEEIFTPLNQQLWQVIVVVAILLFCAGAGVALVWRQQRIRFYQAQMLAVEEKEKSDERYKIIFEEASLGIALIDSRTGQFLEMNPRYADIAGRSIEDMLATDWMMITHPDDVQKDLDNMARMNAGETNGFTLEKRYIKPDKSVVWVRMTVTPVSVDDPDDPRHLAIIDDITKRKQLEMDLKKFFMLAESSSEFIGMCDLNLQPIYVNPAGRSMVGLPDMAAACRVRVPDYFFPEDQGFVSEEFFPRVLRDGHGRVEIRLRNFQTGEALWFDYYLFKVHDASGEDIGWATVSRDITESRRAEHALRSYAERLDNLHQIDKAILAAIDSPEKLTQDAILHLRDLLQCQRITVGLFDFERQEVKVVAAVGPDNSMVQVNEVFPQDLVGDLDMLLQNHLEILEDLGTQEFLPGITKALQAEGLCAALNAPINSPTGLIGALAIGWDTPKVIPIEEQEIVGEVAGQISIAFEQARLTQELKHQAEELEKRVHQRTAQLEAVNQELEAFSYSVSHDLRAPLRHISGYVQLLFNRFRDDLPEKAQYYLDQVDDSANQMGILIDDLLQFSRAGRQELKMEIIEMGGLVKEVKEKLESSLKNREISWEIGELPAVHGDYALLKQVWINLLDNATKYTRKNDRTEIRIGANKESDCWVFFVSDNGVGFDMQYAQNLFGVFQRLHSEAEFEGTGIGLANVKRIIDKHGGRIWAEAQPDIGATFYFTLPH